MNVTTVVLTHRRPDDRPADDEDFVFVTDGIEAAVAKAKELAGDKNVAVNGGQMARQLSAMAPSSTTAASTTRPLHRTSITPSRRSWRTPVPRVAR
jgi:N-acetylglucosamine-6-phosphate deacetylase